MRWIGILAVLLTGCSAPEGWSSFDLDYMQDAKKVMVAPGASAEHLASCSSDRWPVSGGFQLVSNPQSFAITSSMPLDGKWRVRVRNITAGPQALDLIVYIGCVKA
jgi:hypothetical protein